MFADKSSQRDEYVYLMYFYSVVFE